MLPEIGASSVMFAITFVGAAITSAVRTTARIDCGKVPPTYRTWRTESSGG